MSKNNNSSRQLSLEEREQNLLQSTLFMAIVIGIVIFYYGLCYSAYSADHPRIPGLECFAGATSYLSNFSRILQFDYSLGMSFTFVLIVELCIMAFYFTDKVKLHNNLHIIKGSSKWANVREIVKKYAEFTDEKKGIYKNANNNAILSQNMYVSLNAQKHFKALNTLILGTTGSGKSRYFLKPNLLQMNSSYVVTDPKGEILDSCGEMLRRNGYRVRVFDILNMGNCDTYNPLKYCKKESDIKKVVQAFIKNTDASGGKGGSKDPFWDDSMNAFLCAMVAFLTQCPKGDDRPYAKIPEVTGGMVYEAIFENICELTRMANAKWTKDCGIDLLPGVQLGDGKNNTAGASKLAAIFENLRHYEAKLQECDIEEIEKPYCLHEWETFKIAPEKTSTTILMTVGVRLDPFNIEQVRQLTATDTIDLETFGTGRDALFLIIPPTDRTYNFLVAFLYTQLFDILYKTGAEGSLGSKILKLENGELVKYFPKAEVEAGIDDQVNAIKHATIRKIDGPIEKIVSKKGKKSKTIILDDSYYEIVDTNDNVISCRPTKQKAEQYLKDLQSAKLINGKNPKLPYHVRFLMDEFANIGELPEFKDKLATVRGYEISCTVICQSITQLKGMYPDDYEVVDANCPFTIFLGGDENTNNEYLSKKIGKATVKGGNASMDSQNKASHSYGLEERELIKPEELGRLDYTQEIVLIYGEQPIQDTKVDYPGLPNYSQTHDFADDCNKPHMLAFKRPTSSNALYHARYYPLEAVAIPNVFEFTEDTFMRILGVPTMDDAIDNAIQNIERIPFNSVAVDSSTITAF